MKVVRGHLKFCVYLYCERDGGQECDHSVASSIEMGDKFPAIFHSTILMRSALSAHLDVAAMLRGDMEDKEQLTTVAAAMRMVRGEDV